MLAVGFPLVVPSVVMRKAGMRAIALGLLSVVALIAACTPPGGSPVAPGSSDTVVVDGQPVTVLVASGLTVSVEQADAATFPLIVADFAFGASDIDVSDVAPGSVVRVHRRGSDPGGHCQQAHRGLVGSVPP